MRYLTAGLLLLAALGCEAARNPNAQEEVMYRINCGASSEYVDKNGVTWQPDQVLEAGKEWGAIGGRTATREKDLPIKDDVAPELCRNERYAMEGYEFKLPNGTYTVRLHFSETHESNIAPGQRVFDVTVGAETLKDVDPFGASGGFAKPVVMEFVGQVVTDGKLSITFTKKVESVAINAIEIVKSEPAESKVTKLTAPLVSKPVASARKPADVKEAKILFIGNSFTGWWALPETVAEMVNAGPSKLRLTSDRLVRGGAKLTWHYNKSDAVEKIRKGRYDYVVLQPYGSDKEQLLDIVGKFNKVITESGGKTLLYCTWVGAKNPPEAQEPVTKLNADVARTLGITFVPAGAAWQTVRQDRPDLNLHNPDTNHPGMHGAYINTCVFYAVLTGESPVGLPFHTVLKREIELDARRAAYLQKKAWETVQRFSASK